MGEEGGDARGRSRSPPELVPDAAFASAPHFRQLQCLVEGRLPAMVLEQQADLSRAISMCLEVLGIGTSSPERQWAAARALIELVTHPQLRPAVDCLPLMPRLGRIVQLTDSPSALAAAVEALFAIADDDGSWRDQGSLAADALRAALGNCVGAVERVARDVKHRTQGPGVMTVAQGALLTAAAAALRPGVLHLLSPTQLTLAASALATCLTSGNVAAAAPGCTGGGGAGADGWRPAVLAALAAVLQSVPAAGADRAQAARAVVDAGAVPALVAAIRVAGGGKDSSNSIGTPARAPAQQRNGASAVLIPTPPEYITRERIQGESGNGTGSTTGDGKEALHSIVRPCADDLAASWAAFACLEPVLLTCMASAPGAARRATTHALDSGAAEALAPLLLTLPLPSRTPPSKVSTGTPSSPDIAIPEPWRVLRLLLVLARFRSGAVTAAILGGASAADASRGGGGPKLAAAAAAATRDLLSTPRALTDSTAEALLQLFAGLLTTATAPSITKADDAVAGTGAGAGAGALSPAQLWQAAPGLVAAALGILTVAGPGDDWAALLLCAREPSSEGSGSRSPPTAAGAENSKRRLHGWRLKAVAAKLAREPAAAAASRDQRHQPGVNAKALRYPMKLEVAAAKLASRLLAEPAALSGVAPALGHDGSGNAASEMALAEALIRRLVERPGAFEALGDAGVRCLTLSLQLAPPGELWAGERISNAAPLATKLRALLAADSAVSPQLLELAAVAAVSICAGTNSSSDGNLSRPTSFGLMRQAKQRRAALSGARSAALDLMSYNLSVVARMRFLYSPPAKRLAVVAGALNAAVACVAPRRALAGPVGGEQGGSRGGGGGRGAALLLCPSLAGAALSSSAAGDGEDEAWEDGMNGSRLTLRPRLKSVLGRLTRLMDTALKAAEEAGGNAAAGGGAEEIVAGATGGGGSDGGGGAGGGGDGGGESDLDGSFQGVCLAELMPIMSVALRVGANAAAVIAEC